MTDSPRNFSSELDRTNLLPFGQNSQNEGLSLLSIVSEGGRSNSQVLPEPKFVAGQTVNQSVDVNGTNREFALHVPQNWNGTSALPVLYYFNGMHPDGKHEPESFTGLSENADKEGFAVAYMRGSNERTQTYNNGQRFFSNSADENAYLNSVRSAISTEIPLDASRQGLAGFSQGGSEAYALAPKNDWVSSVQSVEGYMTGLETPLNRPISEQNIHALHDPIIPHNGTNQVCAQADREAQAVLDSMQFNGEGYLDLKGLFHSVTCSLERNGNNILPQGAIVSAYATASGGNAIEQVTRTPDQTTRSFINSANGVEARQVTLQQGTHAWAGSNDHSGDIPIIGQPNTHFSATDALSDFFLHHPLVTK